MTDPRTMNAPSGFHPDRVLKRDDLLDDPFAQFLSWLGDAESEGVSLPNAMSLATADAGGRPTVRSVLLRGIDERGFIFYTNRESIKGRQLAENPHAGLVFLWKELDRQVSAAGAVERVGDAESDAYFASRPRDAQLGAWASRQSTPLPDRAALDRQVREAEERFTDQEVPRPPYWGGYRLLPDTIEFWQGRRYRLHDRFRYARDDSRPTGWRIERLSP
jgi:pyridoxamine 5'-phosphate oxidase